MKKMAVLGHNPADLIDCSEAVPQPVPPVDKPTTYPAQKSFADIEQACPSPFPSLSTDRMSISVFSHSSCSLIIPQLANRLLFQSASTATPTSLIAPPK